MELEKITDDHEQHDQHEQQTPKTRGWLEGWSKWGANKSSEGSEPTAGVRRQKTPEERQMGQSKMSMALCRYGGREGKAITRDDEGWAHLNELSKEIGFSEIDITKLVEKPHDGRYRFQLKHADDGSYVRALTRETKFYTAPMDTRKIMLHRNKQQAADADGDESASAAAAAAVKPNASKFVDPITGDWRHDDDVASVGQSSKGSKAKRHDAHKSDDDSSTSEATRRRRKERKKARKAAREENGHWCG